MCYSVSLCYIQQGALINTKPLTDSIAYIQNTRPVAAGLLERLSFRQTQTHSEVPVEAADSNLQRKSMTLPGTKSNTRLPRGGQARRRRRVSGEERKMSIVEGQRLSTSGTFLAV